MTKVNRCLAEGRKAFLERVAGIESGAECERLAPLLSKLADGEAGAEDLAALRPHLHSCLACRARLREYRGAPSRVAALFPLAAGPHLLGRLLYKLQSLFGHVGEIATAQKAAAVAAATAALAGGGVATFQTFEHGGGTSHRSPAAASRPHAQKRAKAPAVSTSTTRSVTGRATSPPSRVAAAPRQATRTTVTTSAAPQHDFAPSPARMISRTTKPAQAATGGGAEFGP